MYKRIISILLLMLQTLFISAQDDLGNNTQAIQVEGTELAQLQSVADILSILPGVSIDDDAITINGRGTPAIYIDNRKIMEKSELMHITADRVKEIEILQHPGAEYDKNVEAVIVIRLKPNEAEGFSLNNIVRFDITHTISPNDELTLGWRRKKLTLGAFVGWNENQSFFKRDIYTNKYQNHKLISEESRTEHTDIQKQWISTRFSATYALKARDKISFNYSLYSKYKDETWVSETSQLLENPDTHQDFSIGYIGYIGKWNVAIGNNSFIDNADLIIETPKKKSYYLRNEYDVRTYVKGCRKIWKGSVQFGVEHDLDHMNVKMYEDNPSYDTLEKVYFNTHAIHPDNTIGIYLSTSQKFKRWTFEAGLRYENHDYVYRPCDDDGLMLFLDENIDSIDYDISSEYFLIPSLIKDREVSFNSNYLYPSLKISTQIGNSELSFKHSENSIRPYLGITRLRYSEMELMNEKILKTEKSSATTIEWKYKYASLAASYTYYEDPICKTLSSSNQYNATNYDAVDFDFTFTPQIGLWTPMFHARLHKQWFEMPLSSGKNRLKEPFASITFNNTVTLPHGWIMRLNALWHSRGAERNNYYFRSDFRLDASIQKCLPKQKLTIILNMVNILRNSYSDFGRYVQEYYGVSQGICDRNIRTVSIAIRYRL